MFLHYGGRYNPEIGDTIVQELVARTRKRKSPAKPGFLYVPRGLMELNHRPGTFDGQLNWPHYFNCTASVAKKIARDRKV